MTPAPNTHFWCDSLTLELKLFYRTLPSNWYQKQNFCINLKWKEIITHARPPTIWGLKILKQTQNWGKSFVFGSNLTVRFSGTILVRVSSCHIKNGYLVLGVITRPPSAAYAKYNNCFNFWFNESIWTYGVLMDSESREATYISSRLPIDAVILPVLTHIHKNRARLLR